MIEERFSDLQATYSTHIETRFYGTEMLWHGPIFDSHLYQTKEMRELSFFQCVYLHRRII